VWQQWCRLGVSGTSRGKGKWLIDPETLLAFTSEVGRHDARLFEQVLGWLVVNGSWINTQRLSAVMKQDRTGSPAVVGAIAAWMCDHDKSLKWRGIARRNVGDAFNPAELLFRTASAGAMPVLKEPSSHFRTYGLIREEVGTRGTAKPVNMNDAVNILFKSRALFGIGIRADAMVYLLTTEGGHARRIADLLGYNHARVQEVLTGLANAGFISVRATGRAKHYWIDRKRWAGILCSEESALPQWVNWRPLTRGLTVIWREAWALDEERADEYIVASKMRTAMRAARDDLQAGGISFSIEDDRPYLAEAYLSVFLRDVAGILTTLSGDPDPRGI